MAIHRPRWREHPAVRTGSDLSLGERAADRLKATFGSWAFLICLNALIVVWVCANALLGQPFDPYPFILLNLGLSWLAAQQGGALQIAANRGDRIASELAMHTYENGQQILSILQQQGVLLVQQGEMLKEIRSLQAQVAELRDAPPPSS
jgi:uncharacterized membrane protein